MVRRLRVLAASPAAALVRRARHGRRAPGASWTCASRRWSPRACPWRLLGGRHDSSPAPRNAQGQLPRHSADHPARRQRAHRAGTLRGLSPRSRRRSSTVRCSRCCAAGRAAGQPGVRRARLPPWCAGRWPGNASARTSPQHWPPGCAIAPARPEMRARRRQGRTGCACCRSTGVSAARPASSSTSFPRGWPTGARRMVRCDGTRVATPGRLDEFDAALSGV